LSQRNQRTCNRFSNLVLQIKSIFCPWPLSMHVYDWPFITQTLLFETTFFYRAMQNNQFHKNRSICIDWILKPKPLYSSQLGFKLVPVPNLVFNQYKITLLKTPIWTKTVSHKIWDQVCFAIRMNANMWCSGLFIKRCNHNKNIYIFCLIRVMQNI
jgi:hypothetical protein